MNNKQYELIGESIWSTYRDIAYLLMGEGSGGAKRLARVELAKIRKSKGRKGTEDVGTKTKETLVKHGLSTLRQSLRGSPEPGVEQGRTMEQRPESRGFNKARVQRTKEFRADPLRGGGFHRGDPLSGKKPGGVAAAASKNRAFKADAARRRMQP
jgi:hypothetical protein